jgi:hypothetical protein
MRELRLHSIALEVSGNLAHDSRDYQETLVPGWEVRARNYRYLK